MHISGSAPDQLAFQHADGTSYGLVSAPRVDVCTKVFDGPCRLGSSEAPPRPRRMHARRRRPLGAEALLAKGARAPRLEATLSAKRAAELDGSALRLVQPPMSNRWLAVARAAGAPLAGTHVGTKDRFLPRAAPSIGLAFNSREFRKLRCIDGRAAPVSEAKCQQHAPREAHGRRQTADDASRRFLVDAFRGSPAFAAAARRETGASRPMPSTRRFSRGAREILSCVVRGDAWQAPPRGSRFGVL